MTKFERVLSDAELISATYKAEVDGTMGELRAVEQAVLAKLAEQEPVAWTSAEIMSGPSFVDDDDYAVMYKTKDHLLNDFCGYPEATPVPLYTYPMTCVSPTSDKTACVSENRESEMQKHVTEEYKRFCDWCDANPSFDLDCRPHSHGGPIGSGGYISDERTRVAFAAWRAAKEGLAAAPKCTGDSNE